MTKTSDVLVIGGGVFGLSSAFQLLKEGLSVTLVDKDAPGSGASGGIVGALSPHMPENWNDKKAFQLKSLLQAPVFWQDVERHSNRNTGYAQIGRLMPIDTAKGLELAQSRASSAKMFWPRDKSWTVSTTHNPDWLSSGTFGAVHETLSARIFPRAACHALTSALKKMGARIQRGTVSEIRSGCAHLSDGTELRAKTLVVAAGYASFSLLGFPKGFGANIKGQAALLSATRTSGPLIFAKGLYVLPHHDGTIAIGSTSEKSYQDADATDDQLDALISQAKNICPALETCQIIERWSGLRPRASRPDPILGEVPNMPGVILASGAFKVGFGLAPAVASAVRDIAFGRNNPCPASFTPQSHLEHAQQQPQKFRTLRSEDSHIEIQLGTKRL